MADHNDGEELSKAYASELWHKYHPAGQEYEEAEIPTV
jgi:hypothetical protein